MGNSAHRKATREATKRENAARALAHDPRAWLRAEHRRLLKGWRGLMHPALKRDDSYFEGSAHVGRVLGAADYAPVPGPIFGYERLPEPAAATAGGPGPEPIVVPVGATIVRTGQSIVPERTDFQVLNAFTFFNAWFCDVLHDDDDDDDVRGAAAVPSADPGASPGAEFWEFCGPGQGWVRDHPDPEATPVRSLEMGMVVHVVARGCGPDGRWAQLAHSAGFVAIAPPPPPLKQNLRWRRLAGHVPSEHGRLRYFRAYVPTLDKLLWLGPIKDVVHTVVWLDPPWASKGARTPRRASCIPSSAYTSVLTCPDAVCARLDALLCPGICAAQLAPGPRQLLTAAATRQRDDVWTDFIDPSLCMAPPQQPSKPSDVSPGGSPRHWQTADIEVDAAGKAAWRSWVNHLDDTKHAELLAALAELFEHAVPGLEHACGLCLRGRCLQVVLRAYEQRLQGADKTGAEKVARNLPYRISEWHADGCSEERIVATATCYLVVDDDLDGGHLELQCRDERTLHGASDVYTVRPRTGSIVCFNNERLCHAVTPIEGSGRRRLVAFHLVDPSFDIAQTPRARDLPRVLWDHRLDAYMEGLFYLRAKGVMPMHLLLRVVEFCNDGTRAADIVALRDAQRTARLKPSTVNTETFAYRYTTGCFPDAVLYQPGVLAETTGCLPDDDDDFL